MPSYGVSVGHSFGSAFRVNKIKFIANSFNQVRTPTVEQNFEEGISSQQRVACSSKNVAITPSDCKGAKNIFLKPEQYLSEIFYMFVSLQVCILEPFQLEKFNLGKLYFSDCCGFPIIWFHHFSVWHYSPVMFVRIKWFF